MSDASTMNPGTPAPEVTPAALPRDPEALREAAIDVIKTVYDPEIPVNIYELGLIYEVAVDAQGHCEIEMTLTAPACPAAGMLPPEVEYRVSQVPGIESAHVEIVWDPPWTMERMSEEARLMLGLL